MKNRKPRHVFAGTTRMNRLRPDEGLVPAPDERTLRYRDRSGQKLRDVINPKTGFCTGVTSPMESDGIPVRAAKPTSGAGTALPELDPSTGRWFVGEDRLVVRTTLDGDRPLTRTRLIKPTDADYDSAPTVEKICKPKKVRAVRPAGDERDESKSNGRRRGPRFTDKEILTFIRDKFGVQGALTITREIRTAAVAAMTKAATVAEYQADLARARGKR